MLFSVKILENSVRKWSKMFENINSIEFENFFCRKGIKIICFQISYEIIIEKKSFSLFYVTASFLLINFRFVRSTPAQKKKHALKAL